MCIVFVWLFFFYRDIYMFRVYCVLILTFAFRQQRIRSPFLLEWFMFYFAADLTLN